MKWKVAIVGPTGPVLDGTAFKLLYSFPTKAEAEAHANCLQTVGMKVTIVVRGLSQPAPPRE